MDASRSGQRSISYVAPIIQHRKLSPSTLPNRTPNKGLYDVALQYLLALVLSPNMAPLRRYLRITKYSVLECRIYLDNPALAQSWLLNPRNPILPKVIESVRPLVLPKLREEKERERAKKKSSKKKSIKDVVVQGLLSCFAALPAVDSCPTTPLPPTSPVQTAPPRKGWFG